MKQLLLANDPESDRALNLAGRMVALRLFGVAVRVDLYRDEPNFKAAIIKESAPLTSFNRAVVGWCGPIAMVLGSYDDAVSDSYDFSHGEIILEAGGLSKHEKESIRAFKGLRQTFAAADNLVRENLSDIRDLAGQLLSDWRDEK